MATPPDPNPLHDHDPPANASGEVDEFQASLAAGAGEGEPAGEAELEAAAAGGTATRAPARRGSRAVAESEGGNRVVAFLRASWAELQRVQWPDRRQVGQATAVVVGFVVVAGAYLGAADYVAKKVVDLIL